MQNKCSSTIPIIWQSWFLNTRLRACPRDELTIDVVAILECSACAAWTLYLSTVGRAVSVVSTLSAVPALSVASTLSAVCLEV